MSHLSYAQNKNKVGMNIQLVGKWYDTSDTNHVLVFTDKGFFAEHPVKFTMVSKSDTLAGRFYIEQEPVGYLSADDTIGTSDILACDPIVKEGAIEFKRRIVMFQGDFLELATWKGGPYLFHRK